METTVGMEGTAGVGLGLQQGMHRGQAGKGTIV